MRTRPASVSLHAGLRQFFVEVDGYSMEACKRRLFSTLPQLNTERRVFGLNLLFSQTVP